MSGEGVYQLAREMAWAADDTCFTEVLKWMGSGTLDPDANYRCREWLDKAQTAYQAGRRPWAA